MDFQNVLRSRRSVKSYDPDHQLTDDQVRELLEAVALTPTSFNMQNWHLVVVRDPEIRARLKAASWNQPHVGDASACIVICGDMNAWQDPSAALRSAPSDLAERFTGMIAQFYGDKPELMRDEGCRSAGLAGMSLMLKARDMGLDSCPMIGFDPAQFSEILELPAHLPPLLLVVIGKAKEPAFRRLGLKRLEEFASLERFGNHGMTGTVDEG